MSFYAGVVPGKLKVYCSSGGSKVNEKATLSCAFSHVLMVLYRIFIDQSTYLPYQILLPGTYFFSALQFRLGQPVGRG